MPRAWSAGFRSGLEDPHNGDPVLVFLDITDPEGPVHAVRVVSDHGTVAGLPVRYDFGGEAYLGYPFEIALLTDEDRPPRGSLTIANVDRRIGPAIKALTAAPALRIRVAAASEFDLTVNPRAPLGTPEVAYDADGLALRDIDVGALDITAVITALDDVSQPWPSMLATQARLPGLFR